MSPQKKKLSSKAAAAWGNIADETEKGPGGEKWKKAPPEVVGSDSSDNSEEKAKKLTVDVEYVFKVSE